MCAYLPNSVHFLSLSFSSISPLRQCILSLSLFVSLSFSLSTCLLSLHFHQVRGIKAPNVLLSCVLCCTKIYDLPLSFLLLFPILPALGPVPPPPLTSPFVLFILSHHHHHLSSFPLLLLLGSCIPYPTHIFFLSFPPISRPPSPLPSPFTPFLPSSPHPLPPLGTVHSRPKRGN